MTEDNNTINQNKGILEAVSDEKILYPMSDVTRKKRKSLLLASLIAFTISIGGLVPKDIKAFGISLSASERDSILIIIALSIIYLSLGFWIYSLADLRSRKLAIEQGRNKIPTDFKAIMVEGEKKLIQNVKSQNPKDIVDDPIIKKYFVMSEQVILANKVRKTGNIRVLYEFYFPHLIGIAAVFSSLYDIRSSKISVLIILFLIIIILLFGSVTYVINNWKRYRSMYRKTRHRWNKWYIKGKVKKLKSMDPNSKKAIKLKEKIVLSFNKDIKRPII